MRYKYYNSLIYFTWKLIKNLIFIQNQTQDCEETSDQATKIIIKLGK